MNKTEYNILKLLSAKGELHFHDLSAKESEALEALEARGWTEPITVFLNGNLNQRKTLHGITPAGRVALSDYREQMSVRRHESIRYWITTAIAVAALIVSIIALLHKPAP